MVFSASLWFGMRHYLLGRFRDLCRAVPQVATMWWCSTEAATSGIATVIIDEDEAEAPPPLGQGSQDGVPATSTKA